MKRAWVLIGIVCLLALAGCDGDDGLPGGTRIVIEVPFLGTQWQVVVEKPAPGEDPDQVAMAPPLVEDVAVLGVFEPAEPWFDFCPSGDVTFDFAQEDDRVTLVDIHSPSYDFPHFEPVEGSLFGGHVRV